MTVAAALGVRAALAQQAGRDQVDVPELIQQFSRSDAGRVLLWPFTLFGQTLTARRVFPEMMKWAAQAALVDLLLLAVVVRLDANYLEAAAGASQRRYERLRRVRGGGVMSVAARGTARRGLPQPPFWFGVGPIAWRQLTNAARSAKGLLFVLFMLAMVAGPLFLAARRSSATAAASAGADAPLVLLLMALGWISVLLASLLKFDFRADLDPMETLKTLPLAPWAIVVGQLVAPVVVMTGIHLLLLGATAATFDMTPGQRSMLGVAAVLSPPFNLLMFAAENLIFLLSPSRPATVGPGDFQILGRQIVTMAVRTVLVLLCAVIAGVFALAAYMLSGQSLVVPTAVGAAVLLAESAALVPMIAWAFRRFDPSLHTPGQ